MKCKHRVVYRYSYVIQRNKRLYACWVCCRFLRHNRVGKLILLDRREDFTTRADLKQNYWERYVIKKNI